MNTPPSGLGFWIAFPKMIEDGSPQAIADSLVSFGARWVAPRAGQGGGRDPSWTQTHTRACLDAGLGVYPWVFSYPDKVAGEVKLAQAHMSEGATGWIIDAEAPWTRPGLRPTCIKYGMELRSALGDTWIADAPWPYIDWHPDYPATGFATWVDARLPQAYWTEIGRPRLDVMQTTLRQWERMHTRGMPRRPVWPIGVTYGRAELITTGIKNPTCPGYLIPEDVGLFVNGDEPWSLYTLEMLLLDSPAASAARALLRSRPPR